MQRSLLLVLLALALPMAAFANNSVDFTNSGGTLSGTNAGLSLSGSELIAVNGLGGLGAPGDHVVFGVCPQQRKPANGWYLRCRWIVPGQFQWKWRSSFRHIVQRQFLRTCDLDVGHLGERNPQLHPQWIAHWDVVYRGHRQWSYDPTNHQHRQRIL